MCGIAGRWVEEINHKIGVEGCSINILIAQLPDRPHVTWAQLRRVERFTAAGGMGQISLPLKGTPWHNFSLKLSLIIQQAQKFSLVDPNTQHSHNKSSPRDFTLSQFKPINIFLSHNRCKAIQFARSQYLRFLRPTFNMKDRVLCGLYCFCQHSH